MLNHSTLLYKLYMRRAVVAVEVIRLVWPAVEVIQLVWAAGLLLVKVAALIKKHIFMGSQLCTVCTVYGTVYYSVLFQLMQQRRGLRGPLLNW